MRTEAATRTEGGTAELEEGNWRRGHCAGGALEARGERLLAVLGAAGRCRAAYGEGSDEGDTRLDWRQRQRGAVDKRLLEACVLGSRPGELWVVTEG